MLKLKHTEVIFHNTHMTLAELRHEPYFWLHRIMWSNTLAWHVWGLREVSHQHLWLKSPVGWGLSHSLLLCPLLWLLSKMSHISSLLQQQCSAPFQTLSHYLIPPNHLMLTLFLANEFSLWNVLHLPCSQTDFSDSLTMKVTVIS